MIEPIALNWHESKRYAGNKGGRLLTPSELLKWSKQQAINVDIWTSQEDYHSPERAMYLHWSRKIPLSKDKGKRCLLVFAAPNEIATSTKNRKHQFKIQNSDF